MHPACFSSVERGKKNGFGHGDIFGTCTDKVGTEDPLTDAENP
jgi:hypothetical protein